MFDIEYSSGAERMESSIRKMAYTPGGPRTNLPLPLSRTIRRRRSRRMYVAGALALVLAAAVYWNGKGEPAAAPAAPRITKMSSETTPPPPRSARVHLREPVDRQLLWLEPSENPTLSWSRVLNANEYDLQIALDSDFKKIVVSEPVSGNSFIPKKLMPDGVYFWRLIATGKSGALKANNFTLSRLEPVLLIKPMAGQAIESAESRGTTANFEWACRPGARLYNVQIAADPEFRKIAASKVVSECRWNNVKLGSGAYHWRVRLEIGPGYREIWSSARPLTIVASASAPPERVAELGAPLIKNPKQIQIMTVMGRQRTPASAEKWVDFLWKPVRGAHQYQVQVARTRDFSDLLSEENTSKTAFKWKATVPGMVFWRVRATSAAGQSGKPSAVGQVTVLLRPPLLKNNFSFVMNDNSESDSIGVEWRPAPLAAQYLVQFGTKRDLAGVKERLESEPRFQLPRGPGRYFVRVAAANGEGVAISPYSNVAMVIVRQETTIERPRLQSPQAGAQAPSKNGRISIEFLWSEVQGAEGYSLEISSDAAFRDVVERVSSSEPRTLLEQVELRGRVYWRVRSTSGGKTSQWSDSLYFDVK